MAEMPRALYGLPVSFGARSLLGLLWSFAGSDAFVWPSRRKLADMLGVDPRSLRRMLRCLEEVGALEESKEWRGGHVRVGWWLVAAPAERGTGGRVGAERELGEEGVRQDEIEDGFEVVDPEEGDVGGDKDDVVGVGEFGEGEGVDRNAEVEAEDRAVRWSGRTGPEGVVVQRTRASEEEDCAVRERGPSSPRGRTVRSPRRNQEPARTNQEPSVRNRDGRGEHERARGGGDEDPDVEDELRALARWRTDGGDPEGLGPWPEAVAANGVSLPPLAFRRKELRARLGEGRSAIDVHRAVHGFAELVRAGVLAVENWRAPYCFAGFFDGLVVAVRQLEAKREAQRQRQAIAQQGGSDQDDSDPPGVSTDAMVAAYAESDSLRSMVDVAKSGPIPPTAAKRPTEATASDELLTVRIRVQAVADLLERDLDDVLRALGRRSLREVEPADADRIDRAFVSLRDGLAVED